MLSLEKIELETISCGGENLQNLDSMNYVLKTIRTKLSKENTASTSSSSRKAECVFIVAGAEKISNLYLALSFILIDILIFLSIYIIELSSF